MHDSKMTRMQLVNELKALREEIRLREERQRNSIVQSGIVASAKGIGPQSRLYFNGMTWNIIPVNPRLLFVAWAGNFNPRPGRVSPHLQT